jgi:hypothetical protein
MISKSASMAFDISGALGKLTHLRRRIRINADRVWLHPPRLMTQALGEACG